MEETSARMSSRELDARVHHPHCIWNLTCLGTRCNVLSASDDCSIRQWKRDREPVGKPLDGNGTGICSLTASPDDTMVVSGNTDGRLRLWNITKGSMVGDPWEGHNGQVWCLDWSPNALEIASGSEDGTIRRWNPDTGRQIASPIETGHGWVYAVKYSSQGKKLRVVGMTRSSACPELPTRTKIVAPHPDKTPAPQLSPMRPSSQQETNPVEAHSEDIFQPLRLLLDRCLQGKTLLLSHGSRLSDDVPQ
ncbi:WD40 repeat-like protein [Suillus weaverae]|nr:WD40 repeat-like protein [Suillus weaverae]